MILAFGVGNMLGMFLGGSGGTFLYAIDRRYPALLAGLTAILGCIPFYFRKSIVKVSQWTNALKRSKLLFASKIERHIFVSVSSLRYCNSQPLSILVGNFQLSTLYLQAVQYGRLF